MSVDSSTLETAVRIFAVIGFVHTINVLSRVALPLSEEMRHEVERIGDSALRWIAELRAWKLLLLKNVSAEPGEAGNEVKPSSHSP